MVACSMPFTAMAASPFIGPTEQGAHDRTIWWDEANPPTSEPEYIGYNSDALSEWWGGGTGGWGMNFGDTIQLDDFDSQYDDLLDEYKPFISVYATDYSTYDAAIYGTPSKNALEACTVKDPTQLKAGDIIALTVEYGGFDSLFMANCKFIFDTQYLQPGYWKNLKGKYSWTAATASGATSSNGVVANAQNIGYLNVTSMGTNVDIETGEVATCAQSSFVGTYTSVYVGADKREYGENGIVMLTLSFSVLEDCSLSDVITFTDSEFGSFVATYADNPVRAVRPELVNDDHTNRFIYAYLTGDGAQTTFGNRGIYGLIAPAYFYGASTTEPEPSHVHGFDGAEAVSNNNGTHTYTCNVAGCDQSEGYQMTESCTFEEKVTPATCTEAGKTVYTCTKCGYSYEEPIDPSGHTPDYSDVVYEWGADNATCTATIGCANCDKTSVVEDAIVKTESTEATCTVPGKVTYTATFDDGNLETQTKVVEGELAPHTFTTKASDQLAKAATCTEAAQYYVQCDVCGAVSDTVTVAVGEPAGHQFTVDSGIMVSAATCQQKQLNKAKCAVCDEVSETVTIEVGELAQHNFSVLVSDEVPATVDAPGKEAVYKCQWCEETNGGAEIPQLPHYVINVSAENGTATVNGEAETDNVAVNGDVTLVATPVSEGYEFIGWTLNGKIVSTDETYVTKAIANATYLAKYAEADADTFTVVFTDQYGNVYSTQTVANGAEVVEPEAPVLAGFTFKGWSLSADQIDALTASTTITANFERAAATQYTVTVGADCTIAGAEGTTTTVDYNTKVTVNAPAGSVNGTWKVNNAVVGYGTSYTFFVGANIELTYVEDSAVEAEPTVAAVTTVKEGEGCEVAFLATRSLAENYTYVNAGFVYGKNLTENDLNLDKVGTTGTGIDSGKVKAVYCSTDSEQFRLSYGITAMTGTASAKAFLAYVDKDGETVVIYGETQSYTYPVA